MELRAKAGDAKAGEVETCLNALYGILMLKLQKKQISEETMAAIKQISTFMAHLSNYYKKDYNNELFSDQD